MKEEIEQILNSPKNRRKTYGDISIELAAIEIEKYIEDKLSHQRIACAWAYGTPTEENIEIFNKILNADI